MTIYFKDANYIIVITLLCAGLQRCDSDPICHQILSAGFNNQALSCHVDEDTTLPLFYCITGNVGGL